MIQYWLPVILFLSFQSFLLIYLIFRFQVKQKQNKAQLLELQKTNQQLLMREKSNEDFVHMATHELKAPVTVLKAYLQLLQLKLDKDKQTDYLIFVSKMDTQLDKLFNLISDLLDAARASSGSINCLMNNFSINECIKEYADGANAAHPECIIEYDLENSDPVIDGDKDRIGQVIDNFITNAIKYSIKEKYIKIISTVENNQVIVKVIDKGPGIPADKQERVFERFFRVPGQSEKLPGLGLGLFICAEIIRKHKGEIGLQSTEGTGSVFWFSIPVKNKLFT